MTDDPRRIALEYLEACSKKDLATVDRLLSREVVFSGPSRTVTGAQPYLGVLERLGAIWLRSELKRVFVEGNEVCLIYALVTDSPAGAVPTVEWLRIDRGTIASVTLIFDRVTFQPASDELARRAGG